MWGNTDVIISLKQCLQVHKDGSVLMRSVGKGIVLSVILSEILEVENW